MKQQFFAWPGWPFLRFAWLLSTANAVWFALIYGGSDWLTGHRTLRVPIHLHIELSIPLIPGSPTSLTSTSGGFSRMAASAAWGWLKGTTS